MSAPSDLNLFKLLESGSERHSKRAANIERLLAQDGEMPADLEEALKAEANREAENAATLERLRQIEARK